MTALRTGNAVQAYQTLTVLRDSAADVAMPWSLIAQAAQAVGRDAEADARVRFLAAEPCNLGALLLIAALKVRRGDDRAAQFCYRMPLNVAALPVTSVAPVLVPMLRAGEAFLASIAKRFAAHLTIRLDPQAKATKLRRPGRDAADG